MVVLIFATGHFGGTLTHGPLFAEPEADGPDLGKIDFNNAAFYADVVKPVLEARCYSCHGELKQKGKLRLDNPELIVKGGKNGKVIEPGNPEESELVQRIDLPVDDEDHMPPKERKQLTEQEKKLISLWIASGADFSKKVTDLVDKKDLFTANENKISLPEVKVGEPDEKLIASLTERGVAITRVARESNLLQVNFVSVPNETQELLPLLKPIAENVVSLKLSGVQDVSGIGDFKNLSNLNLAGTGITDVAPLAKLTLLTSLNLEGTGVTDVKPLAACSSLKYVNLYNTKVDRQQATADLPGVTIEFGGYVVPTLQSDTTVIKTN